MRTPTEETAIQDASIQARKSTHAEISTLPRRFWPLANNSFLLHGCHNYHHLLLIKEKDHLWLGVPGLYDPREAHMANLFGFPQFTSLTSLFWNLPKMNVKTLNLSVTGVDT